MRVDEAAGGMRWCRTRRPAAAASSVAVYDRMTAKPDRHGPTRRHDAFSEDKLSVEFDSAAEAFTGMELVHLYTAPASLADDTCCCSGRTSCLIGAMRHSASS